MGASTNRPPVFDVGSMTPAQQGSAHAPACALDDPVARAAMWVFARTPLGAPPAWAQRLYGVRRTVQRLVSGTGTEALLACPEPGDAESLVRAGYDAVYAALPHSETFRRLWSANACGPDYPDDVDHISFLTLAELTTVAELLALGEGATLVDLACGAGGPGLWLARSAKAGLIGVDVSAVGLELARRRAQVVEMQMPVTFVQGSFASTGLDEGVAEGVVSVDALQYAPDKRAAFAEAARLLRPGGRVVFTAFEVDPTRVGDLPILGDDPVADFGPALEAAEFAVEYYEETPGWRDRLAATYHAVLDARDVLAEDLGPLAYVAIAGELTATLERDFYRRRVLVAARRR